MGSWVTTATGCVFDYDLLLAGKPQRFPVTLRDLAIPHSRSPRWMGVVPVKRAEHLVLTSRRAGELAWLANLDERAAAIFGLLHDSMEAFQADLPRPIKRRPGMHEYNQIETMGLLYICDSFGLGRSSWDPKMQAIVDRADAEMLAVEIRDLVPPLPDGYDYGLEWSAPAGYSVKTPATEEESYEMFVREWHALGLPTVGRA
jgi:hypothetical protein